MTFPSMTYRLFLENLNLAFNEILNGVFACLHSLQSQKH